MLNRGNLSELKFSPRGEVTIIRLLEQLFNDPGHIVDGGGPGPYSGAVQYLRRRAPKPKGGENTEKAVFTGLPNCLHVADYLAENMAVIG